MNSRRIIVIGAGVAGLVAARRLSQAGHAVRVLEAAEVPGGRVGERRIRGIRFNAGARLVYHFSRPFNALLDEIGLTPALVPVRHLSAECVGNDGSWTVELMPGLKSLLTPGLSLAERLRFLRFGLEMLAARRRTDPDDAASAPIEDDMTLADYIRRNLGPGTLERMVEPVFRGTRCWNPEDISAAFFASTAPHLVGRDVVHVFDGGMDRLPRALAEGDRHRLRHTRDGRGSPARRSLSRARGTGWDEGCSRSRPGPLRHRGLARGRPVSRPGGR